MKFSWAGLILYVSVRSWEAAVRKRMCPSQSCHSNHQVTNHVVQQNEATVCQSLFLIKNSVGELCTPSHLHPTQLSFLWKNLLQPLFWSLLRLCLAAVNLLSVVSPWIASRHSSSSYRDENRRAWLCTERTYTCESRLTINWNQVYNKQRTCVRACMCVFTLPLGLCSSSL